MKPLSDTPGAPTQRPAFSRLLAIGTVIAVVALIDAELFAFGATAIHTLDYAFGFSPEVDVALWAVLAALLSGFAVWFARRAWTVERELQGSLSAEDPGSSHRS